MRVLFHTTQLVHPLDSGGRIRTAKLIEQLAREHEVRIVVHHRPHESIAMIRALGELGVTVRTVWWNEVRWGSLRYWIPLVTTAPNPMPLVVRKHHACAMVAAPRDEVTRFAPNVVVCDSLQNEPISSPARRAYLWLEWRKRSCGAPQRVGALRRRDP